ncbi:MFS transporter [Propioniciclava soli]|uniref:MFS transporter n=1 Tax=Propioniciclava soli TaxID=2775081 RepID=UPI001E4E5936
MSSDDSRTPTKTPIPREIWILVVSALLIALGFGLVAPVLPQYAQSFNVGVAAASAIVTVFAVTRLAFAPATGPLMARFGERWTYVAGLFVVALSSFGCAFAQGYWDLIIWRALGGLGSVTFTVASMGLMVRLAPPEARGRTSGLYGSAFLLGNICGPILGSLLAGFGFRVPFLIYGVMLLIATTFVAVFLRGAGGREAADDVRPRVLLADVVRDPIYRSLLVTGFANGWTNFGVRISLIPLMAAAVPTLGVAMSGMALTVYALANAIAQQFTGRFVDAVGRRPVLMVGLTVSGLANLVFGWSTTPLFYLGLSAVAGLGASMIMPAMQAQMADLIGADRNGGSALSTYSMAGDLGSIGGTLVAGIIAEVLGFGWAFMVTGAVLLLAIIPWVVIGRRTPA